MKRSLLSLTIFLPLLIASCVGYSYPKELSTADSLMDARPDRAMHIFKQLTIDSNAPENHRMYYDLLHIKAKDKAAHLEKGDSIIEEVLDYYIDGGDETLLPQAYYYAGRYHAEQHDAPQALDYFQKALDRLPNDGHAKLKSVIASQMGYLYREQFLMERAKGSFTQALKYSKEGRDTFGIIYSLEDLASIYGFFNKTDSALLMCKEANITAEAIGNNKLQSSMLGQIARYYLRKGNANTALTYIRKAIAFKEALSDYATMAIASDVYQAVGNRDSALIYLNKELHSKRILSRRFAHRGLAGYYMGNNPDIAMHHLKKYLELEDTIQHNQESEQTAKAAALYDYQLREKENLELKRDNSNKSYIITVMTGVLLFILTVSTLYYLYNRQKREKYRFKLRLYKERIASSGDNAVSDGEANFFESAQYRLMQERINDGRGLSSEEMNSVREAFTGCYPTFFGHLAELCHTSEHEQIICMLIKLNFSFSNMSLLTHHSPSSISKTRKRLAVRAFGDDAETSAIDSVVRQL